MTSLLIPKEELYKRERNLLIRRPNTVVIVGVGGIGTWAAIFFTLVGANKIILVDHDKLELHNFNRIPLPPRMVGKNKAEAVAELLVKLRDSTVIPIPETFSKARELIPAIMEPMVLVVDCTDNVTTSNDVLDFCKEYELAYLDLKYDGLSFSVRYYNGGEIRKAAISFDADEVSGYREIPSFVGSAVVPALFGLLLASIPAYKTYYARLDINKLLEICGEGKKYDRKRL